MAVASPTLPASYPGLGEAKNQVVVIAARGVGLTGLVLPPCAAAVGEVPAPHIHALGATVAAVEAHPQIDDVRIGEGNLLRTVHQAGTNAAPAALLLSSL